MHTTARHKYVNGFVKEINGKVCIYYDGYWIRYYAPPEDTLEKKRALIENLGRRTFHHTEPGINTPGDKLEMARAAYEQEKDPRRKRVNAAMLAGALFNRATDIFTTIVELTGKGVHISRDNELMRQCGDCFREALELGKHVMHYSGEEGIDELWGEPLKAFTMTMEQFYESRYRKIAQTKRDIDRIATRLVRVVNNLEGFSGIAPRILEMAEAAKLEAETIRSDAVIFEVWPRFVAASQALENYSPLVHADADEDHRRHVADGMRLVNEAKNVMKYLSGARVPMPKTTQELMDRCDYYASKGFLPNPVTTISP